MISAGDIVRHDLSAVVVVPYRLSHIERLRMDYALIRGEMTEQTVR